MVNKFTYNYCTMTSRLVSHLQKLFKDNLKQKKRETSLIQLTARDSICYKASMLLDRKEIRETENQRKGMQFFISHFKIGERGN